MEGLAQRLDDVVEGGVWRLLLRRRAFRRTAWPFAVGLGIDDDRAAAVDDRQIQLQFSEGLGEGERGALALDALLHRHQALELLNVDGRVFGRPFDHGEDGIGRPGRGRKR